MRYLGGKTQIARELAKEINTYRGNLPFLDPFCGSLAMAKALGGFGFVSDIHPALIALYQSIAAGWLPPETFSREEWEHAQNLPDHNPLKGFAGFGCSFRGMYFQGYAGGFVGPVSNFGAQAARQVLLRDVLILKDRGVEFKCQNFFDIEPHPNVFLYLDPPYKGVTGYKGTPKFPYHQFVERVQQWSRFTPICVSEYQFPLGRVVWEKSRARKLIAGSGKRAIERLYLIESGK